MGSFESFPVDKIVPSSIGNSTTISGSNVVAFRGNFGTIPFSPQPVFFYSGFRFEFELAPPTIFRRLLRRKPRLNVIFPVSLRFYASMVKLQAFCPKYRSELRKCLSSGRKLEIFYFKGGQNVPKLFLNSIANVYTLIFS